MNKRYRKKPVIVEAVQLRWDTWSEMCDHADVGQLDEGHPQGRILSDDRIGLDIPTLEGVMIGEEGDWIIRGVKGEFYPCKPDIFEMTYEEVEAAAV